MRNEFKEVTIKFSPKLAEKFTGKDGENYFNIKVPNLDNNDKSPWVHFVLPEKSVHKDNYSEKDMLWAKIPAEGTTTVKRSIKTDEIGEDGKNIYKEESYKLDNTSIEKMFNPKVKEKVNENNKKDVAIRVSKKLVGEPFLAKDGKEYVEVKISNENPEDKTPWAHFVVNPKQVHDDHYVDSCKVIFMPEDGNVTIRREIKTDQLDENGKNIFNKSSDKITVKELEAKFKSNRESVKKKLSEKLSEVEQNKKDTVDKNKSKDKGIGIE